jgi:predicted dehydrogenase
MKSQALQVEERTLGRRVLRHLEYRLAAGCARVPAAPRPIGAGLIGVGNVVHWAYLPRLRQGSPFRLIAVHDLDGNAAHQVAGPLRARVHASLAALLGDEEVEAIFVCTPPQAHCKAVLAALEAGKHVLCEKPLASSLEEAHLMWEAARQAGVVHMVNFSYRFRPEVALLAQIIHAGLLGDIYHVWGTLSQGGWFTEEGKPAQVRCDATAWRFRPGGGVALDLIPHLIDLFRFCFGEIEQVQAWTKSFRPGAAATEDACGFSLSFKGGPIAQLLASRWATGHKERVFLEISGSKGTVVLDQETVKLWTRDEPRWRTLLVPRRRGGSFLEVFHSAVAGTAEGVPTFWDGLKNNEALAGIYQSADSGSVSSQMFEKIYFLKAGPV